MMPRLPLLFLLGSGLASCGLLGSSSEDREAVARYQRNASLYYEGGNFDQALDQARRGLEIDPDDYKLQYIKGWCYLRQVPQDPSMLPQAVAQFETVMAYRAPEDHGPQVLLGYAMCQQKLAQQRLEQAQSLRDELSRVKFDAQEIAQRQAQALVHENVAHGHLDIAVRHLQILIDRGDQLREAHRNLMQTLALDGKYDEAVLHGAKFLERNRQEKARIDAQLEQTTEVTYEQKLYQERDQLIDVELQVRGFLANLFYKQAAYQQAVDQLNAILEEDPTRSIDYYNRGLNLQALELRDEAANDFNRFLATSKLPPGNERVAEAQRRLRELAKR